MATYNIDPEGVTVTDDAGNAMTISNGSGKYNEALEAVLREDYEEFRDICFRDDSPEWHGLESENEDDDTLHIEGSLSDVIDIVKGLINDELITADDLGIANNSRDGHEHDLSQWSGSPIFYPTKEMAREQSDRWGMFWEYHDFGKAAPVGYRYATVPRLGMAPTAPDGYDWVCMSREED